MGIWIGFDFEEGLRGRMGEGVWRGFWGGV